MPVNQLKVGVSLNYVIIILNIMITLFYTPYLLRMLGQNEYGLYSLVSSVIGYLTVLDLGFGNAIIRYTAKYRAEKKISEQYEMFGMFLILYTVIGLFALLLGVILYMNVDAMFGSTMSLYERERAKIMMLILIFNLSFTFPLSIFGSIMTAYERFVFPKIINIVRVLLNTIVMLVLLFWGYKAISLVFVQSFFNITTLLINYFYCKYKLQIHIIFTKFNWSLLKDISIYSFWILLDVVMNQIYWNTGQFVLGAVVGTAAVAVFAIAIHMETLYMQFSSAISSVFLPKITAMVANDADKKEISDLFIKTGRIQNIIMSLILFVFFVFGKAFIELWAGQEYSYAYYMALAFYVALYIPLTQNLGITILQARNQMKFRSLLYIAISFFALLAQILLAKLWGGIGCSIAIAGALLIGQGLVMNIYYYKKQSLDIKAYWLEILKMDIVPVLVTILFYIFTRCFFIIESWSTLILGVISYLIVYVILGYYFSMNKYEKELIVLPVIKKIFK